MSEISSVLQTIVQELASSVQKEGRLVVVNEVPKSHMLDQVTSSGSFSN
jgi:hypothetical protein